MQIKKKKSLVGKAQLYFVLEHTLFIFTMLIHSNISNKGIGPNTVTTLKNHVAYGNASQGVWLTPLSVFVTVVSLVIPHTDTSVYPLPYAILRPCAQTLT